MLDNSLHLTEVIKIILQWMKSFIRNCLHGSFEFFAMPRTEANTGNIPGGNSVERK